MKKYLYTVIFLGIILIFFLTGCSNQEVNNQNTNSSAEKMGTNIVTDDNNKAQKNVIEIKKNATGSDEITISEFSTKIYNKEEARQTNVKITCDKLNGTIVNSGNEFSFEQIVGKATTDKRL